jgi:hypothetical protein
MSRTATEVAVTGSRSWIGTEKSNPEFYAVITQNGDAIAGSIQMDEALFGLATIAGNKQVIYQMDQNKLDAMTHKDDAVKPPES